MARSDDLHTLPPGLPIPVNDGACDHLPGSAWPAVPLLATSGRVVSLSQLSSKWIVVYFYPRTGLPDQDPPGGMQLWDAIPGARGCTPQACSYRDHHAELRELGCHVFGIMFWDTSTNVLEKRHLVRYNWLEKTITATVVTVGFIAGDVPTRLMVLIFLTNWLWIPAIAYYDLALRRVAKAPR